MAGILPWSDPEDAGPIQRQEDVMSFFSWSARRRVVCVAVSVVRRPPRR